MTCKLCNSDAKLCNSHILSEFIYGPLYDEKHSFHVLSGLPNPPRSKEQKGFREELFCESCEGILSNYEDYAKRAITGGVLLDCKESLYGKAISNLDYEKFKLFKLSILFRASISKHLAFSRVKLGPHEEKIRKMILDRNPGSQRDYPCLVVGLAGEKKLTQSIIDQPEKLKIQGIHVYRFIFLGLMWVYFVSSNLPKTFLEEVLLDANGNMVMPIGSFYDLKHLDRFFADMKSKGKI